MTICHQCKGYGTVQDPSADVIYEADAEQTHWPAVSCFTCGGSGSLRDSNLVTIHHRPKGLPDLDLKLGRQSAARAQMETLLAEIYQATGFEPTANAEADFEYGIEELLRTHAGLSYADPKQTQFRILNGAGAHSARPLDPEAAELPEWMAAIYGPLESDVRRISPGGVLIGEELAYWELETFHIHAGREVVLAGFGPDDGSRDVFVEGSRLSGGATKSRSFFIKPTTSKSRPARKAWVNNGMLATEDSSWDWAEVSLEGRAGTVLVQPVITMEYEYRFFIVDGKPVTGAGCVEELTPLDNLRPEEPFDARMRKNRCALSSPISQKKILARYVEFATEVAAQLKEEDPEVDYYTLDVALGSDGQPLVIELNRAGAAGFYAADPYRVAEAFFSKYQPKS